MQAETKYEVCWFDMELSIFVHEVASFDGAMLVVYKELSAVIVAFAALRLDWVGVLSKLKILETSLAEPLKFVSEQASEGSQIISNRLRQRLLWALKRGLQISSMTLARYLAG